VGYGLIPIAEDIDTSVSFDDIPVLPSASSSSDDVVVGDLLVVGQVELEAGNSAKGQQVSAAVRCG
jgi:hypothetical protein